MRLNRLFVLGCLLLALMGSTARPWLPWLTDRPIDPSGTGWCSASRSSTPTQGDGVQAPTVCVWCAASAWALAPNPAAWALRLDLSLREVAQPLPADHRPPVLAAFRARAPPQALRA